MESQKIDFNFEFSAPKYVDFTTLKDGGEPDDSWFDKYEDEPSAAERDEFHIEAQTPPKKAAPKKAPTKPMTPKLSTAAYE